MAGLPTLQLTNATTLLFIVALGFTYLIAIAIYRLCLSPLAKIPGPKIAALTSWYNGYHDLVAGGQYVHVVEEMHAKYGPIVRTRPDTIHINDPFYIDEIYSQSPKRRRERFSTVVQTLQAPGSVLASVDHDLHRHRRAALNPFFSQQNVRRLEPLINDVLANLLNRFSGWAREGKPITMSTPLRAATKDVIQAYALGGGQACLEMEDCNAAFFDVITPQRVVHLGTHVYWLAVSMASLPPAIMTTLIPRVGVFATFMTNLAAEVEQIRKSNEVPEHKTIFHEIKANPDLPESEKRTVRLTDEAMVLLIAGSETTASTLGAIMYHMLSDRAAITRLRDELKSVMPGMYDVPVAAKLDGLPYFNAVINEAIRLYPGATHRQDRCAPDENLVYTDKLNGKTYTIPAGTGIGMAAPIVNRNPELYDRPDEFIPDRYIDNPGLLKYNFSFSKGTRQCLGINLAYQELYTFVAGIFRRYDMYDPTTKEQAGPTLELYETVRTDVSMYADYITPGQHPSSQGLRVIIRE